MEKECSKIQKRASKAFFLLTFLCALIFVFSLVAVAADSGHKIYLPSQKSNSGYLHLDVEIEKGESEDSSVLKRASSLPSKYDSRDKKLITSVKDQGEYGACWAFSAISACESSLIKEFPEKYTNKNTDLSEVHLAYFTFSKATDELNLTAGDYTTIDNYNFLDVGGNSYFATFSLAKWFGVADESVAPYKTANSKTKLSNSLAYSKNKAVLENAYWVSMNDTDSVKKMIMQYGSCTASYYQDDLNLNLETGGYYQWLNSIGNHAISIVGWDDNYSRDNFGGMLGFSFKPRKNGAWLVKNSYGTEYGNNGYIWVSYEDRSLQSDCATFFDLAPTTKYDKNYQYDGSCTYSQYNNKSKIYMANTFTSSGNETLKAISFCTADPNMNCSYQIYKNVKGTSTPIGTAVFDEFVSCNQKYAGYHTVELPKSVSLSKGEKFSVVVKIAKSDKTVSAICDYSGALDSFETIYSNTTSKKGQSFLSYNFSKWQDLYSKGLGENFRIKAFTTEKSTAPKKITLSKSKLSLEMGKTEKLSFSVSPSSASTDVTWSSSDKSVATISSSGKLTAVSCGKTVISCKSRKNSKIMSSVTVTVVPTKVSSIEQTAASETSLTVKWKAQKGVDGYLVYKVGTDSKKERIAKTKTNSVKISELKGGTKYKLYIVAYKQIQDTDGNKTTYKSPYGSAVTAVTSPKKVAPKAKSVTKNSITLSWKSVKGAQSYKIYVYNEKSKKYEALKTTEKTSFKVTGLSENKTYRFIVKARIKNGGKYYYSAKSDVLKVKTKTK